MEYMIMIHGTETQDGPMPGSPAFEAYMASWLAFNQILIDGGHWVSGGSLQPTATATTLRRATGTPDAIVDGPFAETKEQLAGYYLIAAADLDEALALAAAMPLTDGYLEIRPVAFRPDAIRPDAG
jgi:hypothetical protein